MSLIHDALKSMDAPQDSRPAMARAPKAAVRGRPAWLDATLAFAVVLGVGILGWFVWQTQLKPKVGPQPMASAPLPAPAAPVAAPAATGTPAPAAVAEAVAAPPQPVAAPPVDVPVSPPVAAAVPAPMPATAVAVVAAPPVAATAPAPGVVMEAAAPKPVMAQSQRSEAAAGSAPALVRSATARQPRSAARPVAVSAAPAPAPASVVEDAPVELRFARFVSAMKESRTTDAERELAGLKERLPAGSLGLLRAQAWFDLRAGRDAAAADGYRAILERMPGDEEAAINLASIQSRQQKPEEARATLDAATRLHPDSVALRAALAQFTPSARQ